jgi:hypothetical protein
MRIQDGDRRTLATSPHAAYPELTWIAPADGRYALVVDDPTGGGGRGCAYEIALGEPYWDFGATVPEHSYRLRAGSVLGIPVIVNRSSGYRGILWFTPVNLPAGVSSTPLASGPASGEVLTLELAATPEVSPAGQPFSVVIQPGDLPLGATRMVEYFLVGKYAPPGGLLINRTDQLWLTLGDETEQESDGQDDHEDSGRPGR